MIRQFSKISLMGHGLSIQIWDGFELVISWNSSSLLPNDAPQPRSQFCQVKTALENKLGLCGWELQNNHVPTVAFSGSCEVAVQEAYEMLYKPRRVKQPVQIKTTHPRIESWTLTLSKLKCVEFQERKNF
jgi:hypothetical protein